MKVPVHMLAVMNGEIRQVEIPDDVPPERIVEEVFRLGQNEFQRQEDRCSVSAGDVAEIDGKYHLYLFMGTMELTPEEFRKWCDVPDRALALNPEAVRQKLEEL